MTDAKPKTLEELKAAMDAALAAFYAYDDAYYALEARENSNG